MRKQAKGNVLSHLLTLLGLAVVCLPVLLSLMPNLATGRAEARIARAYDDVRRLRDEYVRRAPNEAAELPEIDPGALLTALLRLTAIRFVSCRLVQICPLNQVAPRPTTFTLICQSRPRSPFVSAGTGSGSSLLL